MHTIDPPNALIYGLCRFGKLKEATSFLDEMRRAGLEPDQVTYTILIDGLCKEGNLQRAFEMRNATVMTGIKLDKIAYTALITGLTRQGRVGDADSTLHEMLIFEDMIW